MARERGDDWEARRGGKGMVREGGRGYLCNKNRAEQSRIKQKLVILNIFVSYLANVRCLLSMQELPN